MAADDAASGRRTRSGRSAPVINIGSGRRTRKSATAEDDPEVVSEEITIEDTTKDNESAGETEIAMTTDTDPIIETLESNSSSGGGGTSDSSPDDQFIHIPDGNGVANSGFEHVEDTETTQSEDCGMRDQTEVVNEKSVEVREAEELDTNKDDVVTEEKEVMDVEEEKQDSVLKRKTEVIVDDVDGEIKKQKMTEMEVEQEKEEEKKEEAPVKKHPRLPDLVKYWKPVQEDSTNFTGWTYLLQYVDQETDVIAARDAYDAFLGHYPYCYGYWRKYADYEKNKGDRSKCDEVFERGLKAIPLSVDLWIHYLNYVKASHPADEALIRSQYERALNACGLEFRSDKLWEAYIKWETEGKRLENVVKIYDRLLATPTLGYNSHYGTFSDFVRANAPKELVDVDTYAELRKAVAEADMSEDEVEDKIRKKVISARKKIHEATVQEVTNRWTFEEAVKRPYFHVKPLERCQLKNWMDYLDFEIEVGDRRRITVLFERCLIACALYEEYWQKFLRFLLDATPDVVGTDNGVEETSSEETEEERTKLVITTRNVFERACTIHHKDKPRLHLMWSTFEECHGNAEKAAEILENIDQVTPNLLQIEYRRINVERRRGRFDECEELFDRYVSGARNQHVASSLAIKHARFVHKIRNDFDRAMGILRAIQKSDPLNVRIPLQMIDLAIQRPEVDEEEILRVMDGVIERKEGLETEQKVLFAQRKVEFLEDFGLSPRQLQKAQKQLQTFLATLQEEKKAKSLENNDNELKQIHSTVAPAAQQQMPPQQPPQQNQYANYSSYYGAGSDGGAASTYGTYSDANYWNQYGQYAGNNYGNYYQ